MAVKTQAADRGVAPALGLGPMSRNAVDMTIQQAYAHRRPIMLIASRRQIEMAALGGGYVEGWDTVTFADYVRTRDPDRLVLLCRDHGGPWQHPSEVKLGYDEPAALATSTASFTCDIEAGFDLLHIDTSADFHGSASRADALRRLVSLYQVCLEAACEAGRCIEFEIGFERQDADTDDPPAFQAEVSAVIDELHRAALPAPRYIVAQTGTKVVGTENVGALVSFPNAVLHAVRDLVIVCRRGGAGLKVHNADYLPAAAVKGLLGSGVAALNIAPEIGVEETRRFLELLAEARLRTLRERFIELVVESRAWEKWVADPDNASDLDKATLAGHYVFSTRAFHELKQEASIALRSRYESVDDPLRRTLAKRISTLIVNTCEAAPGDSRERPARPEGVTRRVASSRAPL